MCLSSTWRACDPVWHTFGIWLLCMLDFSGFQLASLQFWLQRSPLGMCYRLPSRGPFSLWKWLRSPVSRTSYPLGFVCNPSTALLLDSRVFGRDLDLSLLERYDHARTLFLNGMPVLLFRSGVSRRLICLLRCLQLMAIKSQKCLSALYIYIFLRNILMSACIPGISVCIVIVRVCRNR